MTLGKAALNYLCGVLAPSHGQQGRVLAERQAAGAVGHRLGNLLEEHPLGTRDHVGHELSLQVGEASVHSLELRFDVPEECPVGGTPDLLALAGVVARLDLDLDAVGYAFFLRLELEADKVGERGPAGDVNPPLLEERIQLLLRPARADCRILVWLPSHHASSLLARCRELHRVSGTEPVSCLLDDAPIRARRQKGGELIAGRRTGGPMLSPATNRLPLFPHCGYPSMGQAARFDFRLVRRAMALARVRWAPSPPAFHPAGSTRRDHWPVSTPSACPRSPGPCSPGAHRARS